MGAASTCERQYDPEGPCCVKEWAIKWAIRSLLARPNRPFDKNTIPTAPDYALLSAWVAFPGQASAAFMPVPEKYADPTDASILDVVLEAPSYQGYGVSPQTEANGSASGEPLVDCFFVHPTGYFGTQTWNASLADTAANEQTDWHMAMQASAFNGSCRVYAPRYREATLASYLYDRGSGLKAFEIAYSDVRRAFLHYLEHHNMGRPFVLASHSQGGWHLNRLLQEEVDCQPSVLSSFICCYLIGSRLPMNRFPHFSNLHACDGPRDLKCVIGFDTRSGLNGGALSTNPGHWYPDGWRNDTTGRILATDPYTWRNHDGSDDGKVLPASLSKGIMLNVWWDPENNVVPKINLKKMVSGTEMKAKIAGIHRVRPSDATTNGDPHFMDITTDQQGNLILIGGCPQDGGLGGRFEHKKDHSYHSIDYNLFFWNIRENVKERVDAWHQANKYSN